MLIDNEQRDTLRDVIICLYIDLRLLDGPNDVIRTDPALGFASLVDDKFLLHHRIRIETGRVKNVNKDPVAEKCVQELECELLRQNPTRGAVTPTLLAVATARLNTRLRASGLYSKEMWYQRDQFSRDQLPAADRKLILMMRTTCSSPIEPCAG